MNPSPNSSVFVTVAIVALVAWRLYSRIRRMVGRQRLSRVRPGFTVVLLPLVVGGLVFASRSNTVSMVALLAGVAGGAALGVFGLRLTKFESGPQGWFYTPNAHLGIALSVLLIARIGYRIARASMVSSTGPPPPATFVQSPLTLIIFGTLAGYYVTYAVGLLRWQYGSVPKSKATSGITSGA